MTKRALLISLLAVWMPVLVSAKVTPLGSEFQANTYTLDDQGFPSVCSDSAGNFVVVWGSYSPPSDLGASGEDGDRAGVFGRRFASDGGARGTEFQVNTYTTDLQVFPIAACADDGAFVVVWTSYSQDGDNYGVFGQRFNSDGQAAGSEFQVNSFTSTSQDYVSVASDSGGNFVVVWASYAQDDSGFGIIGRLYSSGGEPLGPEFQVNTFFTGRQIQPVVSRSFDGAFVVVWASYDQDGDEGGVFGQRYNSSGTESGSEFQVNSLTVGRQYEAAVSMDDNDNFVVAWTSTEGDGYSSGIFGQRYDSSGARAGTEFVVNSYTTGTEYAPAIALDPEGNFVIAWTTYDYFSPDGDITGVFGRQFDNLGTAIGSEFQINQYTLSYQSYPAIAAQGVGQFVVTWQSYDQDGYGFGIIGRRFEATTTTLLGDCNRDGRVTVNELVVGIYVALDLLPLSDCEAIDGNMDGRVLVDDLVGAVANALPQ